MLVSQIMSRDVITVRKESTLREAATKLFQNKISGLVVVDESNKILGIVSEKDLYKVIYPDYDEVVNGDKKPAIRGSEEPSGSRREEAENNAAEIQNINVAEFMTRNVETVSSTDPIMKAGAIMLIKKINRLPVVDEEGKVIGIVSRRDVYGEVMRVELGVEIKPEYEIKYQSKLKEKFKKLFGK